MPHRRCELGSPSGAAGFSDEGSGLLDIASIGRQVHYQLELPNGSVVHRPARITSIDPNQTLDPPAVNLHVDIEPGDFPHEARGTCTVHIARVRYYGTGGERPGTWHWPERV